MIPLSQNGEGSRLIVIGRTGSGKTVSSLFALSRQNFHEIPWVCIDYKRDRHTQNVKKDVRAKTLDITKRPPERPGLYFLEPKVNVDDDAIDDWLWRVYEQGNTGIYLDEGYALPQERKSAFTVLLTQGRSLNIPVIALYQRPVWMNKFTVAQADYFSVFSQNVEDDLKTTKKYIKPAQTPDGRTIDVETNLPPHYSLWFDVGENETTILRPCPAPGLIRSSIAERLNPSRARRLESQHGYGFA